MLRSLVLLGFAVIAALAVPAAYERNPEFFNALLAGEKSPHPSEPSSPPVLPAAASRIGSPEPPAYAGRRVRLQPDSRGHFTAEFRMNGRRVEGLIDTGATLVAINRSTARRIGIHLSETDFMHEVRTANGKTRAAAAMIDRIEIGRIAVEDVPVAVLDDRALGGTLVGMSFLARLKRFEAGRDGLVLEQ
jgi:aspartyl protease family protein